MVKNHLTRLSTATRALAEVSSASEAWELSRTAEAARQYAKMKGLGTEAVNYATGIKAKAMILLADFIDAGQADGTIVTRQTARSSGTSPDDRSTVPSVLGTETDQQAYDAVREARRLRAALDGADVDGLISRANNQGEDLGLKGLRFAAAASREPAPVCAPMPLPPGKFSCIVIDPPWPMKKIKRDIKRPNQAAFDYAVMSEDELGELEIPLSDDCHVWTWTTHKFLPMALRLLDVWGLRYVCTFVWHKPGGFQPMKLPQYNCEFALYARRGSPTFTTTKELKVCFEAPRGKHSEKPQLFYDMVRRVTSGPRLDMFNRRAIDGFRGWGLEAA